jgi:putative oxidoreductase
MAMTSAVGSGSGLVRLVRRLIGWMELIPYWLIALVARLAPAGVFWRSGQTKLNGWHVTDSAVALFGNEFQLPILSPWLAAHITAYAEFIFPVLLVLGLATRFTALGMLIMTAVIEIFVFPNAWPIHGTWAACFLILMTRGPGVVSLDHFIAQRYR